MGQKRRAVFLDRDGVLNRVVLREGRPHPPSDVQALELIPGVVETCAALRQAGALLFCVTNQPDVARGTARHQDVAAINEYLRRSLGLHEVATCFHDDKDECDCRKPKPGMLLDLGVRYDVDLKRSVMVGDRWRDIEAGARAGCRTVFIDYGYRELQPRQVDLRVKSLAEAGDWIMNFMKVGTS